MELTNFPMEVEPLSKEVFLPQELITFLDTSKEAPHHVNLKIHMLSTKFTS